MVGVLPISIYQTVLQSLLEQNHTSPTSPNILPLLFCFAEQFSILFKITIVNYDKENGFILFDGLRKTIPQISDNVDKLFGKVGKDGSFFELLQNYYLSDKFEGDPFKDWVDGLDNTKKSTLTAGEALSQYKTHLQSADKASSKFGSTLKSIGGSIASGLANFAIGAAIGFAIDSVIKAIDYFTVTYDELQSAFQNSQSNYSSAKAEVESVQTELEQINTQIDAINSQPLTLSSEAELARLQSEKSELEEILSVKQSIADASRQKLALDAYKASKAETSLNEGRKAGQSDTTKGFMDFENWMMGDELIYL